MEAGSSQGSAGKVVRCEADRFDRLDGSIQWLRWELRPWYDATGGVGGIVIFIENLSERKRSEEQLKIALKEANDIKAALNEHSIVAVTHARGERERSRIGHDLHDGLCQHLAGVEFRLPGLNQRLEHRDKAPRPRRH